MDAVAAAASPHAVDEAGRRARHRRREQKRQRHLHSPASTSTTAATAMPAAASGADQQQAHTAPSPVTLATSDGPSSTARLRLPPQPPVPIACPPAERSPEPQALQYAAERLPVLSQPANAAAPVTPNALAVGASPVLRSARAIDADVSVIGRTTRPLGIVRASRRPPEKDEDGDEYEEVPEDESGAGGLKGKNTSDAPGEYQLEGDSGDRVKKHETRGGGAPTPKASEAKDSGRQMSELLHSLLNRLGNAAFAMRPLPPGARVCCRVTRNEKLMFRGTTAEYTLCIEDMGAVDCSARGVWGAHREVTAAGESSEREQQPKCAYLLAARRKFKCRGLQYLISTDPLCIHKRFDTYIGKLRSLNFMGSEFALFDNGQNPTRIGASRLMRRELAFIRYERQGFLSPKHPRELLVALPTLVAQADGSKAIATIKPMCPVETIGARLSRHDADSSLLVLKNRPPHWDPQLNVYFLDFGGRAALSSVKNFQLVLRDESEKLRALELEERKARGRAERERKRHSSEDKSEATRKPSAASATGKENDEQKKSGRQVCSPQTALLQFGRRSSHCFTLDFSHPIAPIQAFAIALSSMHTKLGVD